MVNEPENNKRITHIARAILRLSITCLFALVWVRHYSHYVFGLHFVLGTYLSVGFYYFIYNWFCDIYKAFRFASTSITEIVFSQFISFGITDFIFYVLSCVSDHQMLNIIPGMATVIIQLLVTAVVVQRTKQMLMKHLYKEKTLIIKGNLMDYSDAESFVSRLEEKYNYLFYITQIINENESEDNIKRAIDENHNAILFDISENNRGFLIRYCLQNNKQFFVSPRIEDIIIQGCKPRHLLDTPLWKYEYSYNDEVYDLLKRIIDVVLSLLLIIILSPFMLLTAIVIKREDYGVGEIIGTTEKSPYVCGILTA